MVVGVGDALDCALLINEYLAALTAAVSPQECLEDVLPRSAT